MKAKHLIAVLAVVLLGLHSVLSCSQKAEESIQEYTKFNESVFSLEVPSTWNRMKGAELDQVRQQLEEQSKQLARQYAYTRPEDLKGVPYLAGFSAPRQQALFVAALIQIPPQATDYLDQMYEQSKERIRWGIEQGIVREVFSNRKTEINGIPALEVDTEMADESRGISYYFYFSDHPDQAVMLILGCKPGQYATYQSAFDHIISTIRASFPKTKSE